EPDLPGIDVDDLIGGDRAANVCAGGLDSGCGPHFSGYGGGNSVHLGQRCAWGPLHPYQDVAILQSRQHGSTGSEPGDQDGPQRQDTGGEADKTRLPDGRQGKAIGTAADPAVEWTGA